MKAIGEETASDGGTRKRAGRRWPPAIAAVLVAGAIALAVRGGWSPPGAGEGGGMRIVSLAPSVTEMLYVLGSGGQLVGATEYCDWPPEAREIQRVGGLGVPNMEMLLAMQPDLVITTGLERADAAEVLARSGIRVLDIRIEDFETLFAGFLEIGRATGTQMRAEEAVAAMRARLALAAERYRGIGREERLRVFVEMHDDPLTTIGGTSFIDEMIERAGGVNLAHDLAHPYPHINPEMVIAWDPDVILVCHMIPGAGAAAGLRERIGWGEIKAIREGRIIDDIPADLILRPGPRVVDGVEALAQRLYGR